MDWKNAAELSYLAGVLCALAILGYGAWLCVAPPRDEFRVSSLDGHSRRAKRHLKACGIALIVVVALPGKAAPALAADPHFERGLDAYHASTYLEAIGQFRLAADQGDRRAQEILGFMYLHGQGAFGPMVSQDRVEATHWFRLAADGGREVAQYMLCVLSRTPAGQPADRGVCVSKPATVADSNR